MEFNFITNPRTYFGPGKVNLLPDLVNTFGRRLLLITGQYSFRKSVQMQNLMHTFADRAIEVSIETVGPEPPPQIIDDIVEKYRQKGVDVVAGVGGGSVVDAGKAVSAMLMKRESVVSYLEGVGHLIHDGQKVPYIAVPTTAGTGSEATKNAVLTRAGKNGFKKSLRHDRFVPDIAIVDPELTLDCPADVTAACGMDALTQLLEALMSTHASPMTDVLVMGALHELGDALVRVSTDAPRNVELRSRISYASYISGVALANAGLGVVHGFASVIGGMAEVPHGVVCGTLLAEVLHHNFKSLASTQPESPVLIKAQQALVCLTGQTTEDSPVRAADALAVLLAQWTQELDIPRLSPYGVTREDLPVIASATGLKHNPVPLSTAALTRILEARL